jgi:tetratricopeptide (TPR) repeat protein
MRPFEITEKIDLIKEFSGLIISLFILFITTSSYFLNPYVSNLFTYNGISLILPIEISVFFLFSIVIIGILINIHGKILKYEKNGTIPDDEKNKYSLVKIVILLGIIILLSFLFIIFYYFIFIQYYFIPIIHIFLPVNSTTIQPNPSNNLSTAEGWIAHGHVEYKTGNYQSACHDFEQAIRIDQNNPTAWVDKGNVLNRLGSFDEAISASERSLRLDPNNVAALENKGDAYNNKGSFQDAIDAYDLALTITIQNANVSLKNGEVPSVEVNQQTAHLFVNKGNALYNTGRYQEAYDNYNRAISFDPDNSEAWDGRGDVLNYGGTFPGGDEQDALDAYDRALHLNPRDTRALNEKGNLFEFMKNYTAALDAYSQSLKINASDATIWIRKGNILFYHRGDHQEGLIAYQIALGLKPYDPYALYSEVDALDEIGTNNAHEGALDILRKMMKNTPNDTAAFNRAGDISKQMGTRESEDQALAYYALAQEIDKNNVHALLAIQDLLSKQGRDREAYNLSRRIKDTVLDWDTGRINRPEKKLYSYTDIVI